MGYDEEDRYGDRFLYALGIMALWVVLPTFGLYKLGVHAADNGKEDLRRNRAIYAQHSPEIEGVVTNENYRINPRGKSSYEISLDSERGRLSLNIIEKKPGNKELLEEKVEVGSRISFQRGNGYLTTKNNFYKNPDETFFSEGVNEGSRYASNVSVDH